MTPSSPPFLFSDEDMDRIMNLVLTSLRQTLVENIDPRHYLAVLRQCFVIDGRESDEIKSACSRSVYEGTEKFLDTLMTKGSRGYNVFCEALLCDCTQLHLLNQLTRRLEQFKHNFQTYVEQQRYCSADGIKDFDAVKRKPVPSIPHHHLTQHAPQSTADGTFSSNDHSNPQGTTVPRIVHRARSPMPDNSETQFQEYYPEHMINESEECITPIIYHNGFPAPSYYKHQTVEQGQRYPPAQRQCSTSFNSYAPVGLSVTGSFHQQAPPSSSFIPAVPPLSQITENFQHQFYVNHFTQPTYPAANNMINTEQPLDGPCGQYVN